ncbi:MAG: zinc ribbon domain-containing protein [Anaerolineaceae bacterium]|nr:zinc ribbon domain-containing protein [Anaerolineaceae bacterium]
MPIYVYKCQACGHEIEIIRPMSDADKPVVCDNCKSNKTSRQLSTFNAQRGGKAISGCSPSCGDCTSHNCASCHH